MNNCPLIVNCEKAYTMDARILAGFRLCPLGTRAGGQMGRTHTLPAETSTSWSAGSRRRMPFYLAAAVLLAILAGVLAFNFLNRIRLQAVPSEPVLVAVVDIQPGSMIQPGMVEIRTVPWHVLPVGHMSQIDAALGRITLYPIKANEILLPSRFAGHPEAGLSARLPDGRWAMVLPGGWLVSPIPEVSAGDRIDLLSYQGGEDPVSVGVIVTAVQILEVVGTSESATGLVLAVSLEQAEVILIARANGFSILPLLRPREG